MKFLIFTIFISTLSFAKERYFACDGLNASFYHDEIQDVLLDKGYELTDDHNAPKLYLKAILSGRYYRRGKLYTYRRANLYIMNGRKITDFRLGRRFLVSDKFSHYNSRLLRNFSDEQERAAWLEVLHELPNCH